MGCCVKDERPHNSDRAAPQNRLSLPVAVPAGSLRQ
jgi:hypothetical protein